MVLNEENTIGVRALHWQEEENLNLLKLNDAYPTCLSAVAWTERNIVRVRESDLDGEVWTQTASFSMFSRQPESKLLYAWACLLIRNGPFCRVLQILYLGSEKNKELRYEAVDHVPYSRH